MSSIDNAKQAIGWIDQRDRPGCGNCAHVTTEKVDQVFGGTSYRCTDGGFFTKRFSICDKHITVFKIGGVPK